MSSRHLRSRKILKLAQDTVRDPPLLAPMDAMSFRHLRSRKILKLAQDTGRKKKNRAEKPDEVHQTNKGTKLDSNNVEHQNDKRRKLDSNNEEPQTHKKTKHDSNNEGHQTNKGPKLDSNNVKEQETKKTDKNISTSSIDSAALVQFTHHIHIPSSDIDDTSISSDITHISNSYSSLSTESKENVPPQIKRNLLGYPRIPETHTCSSNANHENAPSGETIEIIAAPTPTLNINDSTTNVNLTFNSSQIYGLSELSDRASHYCLDFPSTDFPDDKKLSACTISNYDAEQNNDTKELPFHQPLLTSEYSCTDVLHEIITSNNFDADGFEKILSRPPEPLDVNNDAIMSKADDDNDLVIENYCLDEPSKVTSNSFNDTNNTQENNCDVMRTEKDFEDKEKMNNTDEENLEAGTVATQDEGKFEDTLKSKQLTFHQPLLTSENSCTDVLHEIITSNNFDADGFEKILSRPPEPLDVNNDAIMSKADDDNDLVIENYCLDGPSKVTSNSFNDTNNTQENNCDVMRTEKDFEDKEKMNNTDEENLEAGTVATQDEGKLEDTLKSKQLTFHQPLLTSENSCTDVLHEIITSNNFDADGFEKILSRPPEPLDVNNDAIMSKADDDNDLVIENYCLDGPSKVTSNSFNDTNNTQENNSDVMRTEKDFEDEEKMKNTDEENLEAGTVATQDEGKLEDTLKSKQLTFHQPLLTSENSCTDLHPEIITSNNFDVGGIEKTISRPPTLLDVNNDAIMSEAPSCSSGTNVRSAGKSSNYQFHDVEETDYEPESDHSMDRNYVPSSSTSSTDDENDLVIESDCLDGPSKVTSSSINDINNTQEKNNNVKQMRTEEDFEDEENTNEENLEAGKVTTHDEGKSEDTLKSKRIRERDFCYYCESFVLNFSRHMVRNHLAELEVQLALSHPKKSLKRKTAFAELRKKGNYISNSQSAFKPVKKCRFSDKSDYLPCSKCLGFYSKKHLWRHVKKCNNTGPTKNAQATAQNFLVRHVKTDKNLVEKVFPRMRPDKVSLVAKKDKLICMFGAQYLRIHREAHFATVVSRKMREMAKLLMEVTKLQPDIQSVEQMLKPQYYDTLVLATKMVARYNNDTRQFSAPTYAMNIATSVKQCCSIALMQSCKVEATTHTATIQSDLKTLSQLISENWKFDVSSEAADDLNVKKWNKTTIVPLATDLNMFKNHLCTIAQQASANLSQSKEKTNEEAFNTLVESVYCRVLLLNRRRPGELQRLKINEYNEHCIDTNKYEEFDKVLSPTEKILVDTLKRIVIRGKRGRGVPVLFSSEVQNDIQQILSVRKMYIEEKNNFLFAKAGGVLVCGYKILEKYAKACGAKNYRALTSTRLRKHLATMTQLFTMNESDLEQLATFMGHTLSVHRDNYRLPNDVYQTAKISKLLLLMEDGKADKFKGKSLDEIDLNLDEDIRGTEIENEEVLDMELELNEDQTPQNDDLDDPETKQLPPPLQENDIHNTCAKKKRTLIPWTTEQKDVVIKFFKQHIKNKKPPKRGECDELKNKYPTLLHNKDWLKIKVFIQNKYSKT